jgi:hypothetical protein
MKTCGSGNIAPPFLTSALDGGEWSAWRRGRFTYGEMTPRFPLDRLGGSQSQSGRCRKDKNLTPVGIRTPAVQLVARRYTDWAIPTPAVIDILVQKNSLPLPEV